jgi:hypothetical protein
VISSFQVNNSSTNIEIGELNPFQDLEDPDPNIERLWTEGDVIKSVFWVWHCTLVLYCFDKRLPNIEFVTLDNQLGIHHGKLVIASIKIDKFQSENVLISEYNIEGELKTVEAFFYPENKMQFVHGIVETKTKTDNLVIVNLRNEYGLYKVFINARNPKFVNTDHVLNQDSIMVNDEVSMLVNQVQIGGKNQLAVINEYSILITRPASRRIKKCRLRATKINSMIFKLQLNPEYHPTVLSKILETGSLEEVSRFYFTVDQRIAIDRYILSIPLTNRPIFRTNMENEYFDLLSVTTNLEMHHPLTLTLQSISNLFHSFVNTEFENRDQLINMLKIHKLLAHNMDHVSYTRTLRSAIRAASLNLRYRDNDLYGEFTIELLKSLLELPICVCLNDYLMDLLSSYPTHGMNDKLENNSKVFIESIFQFFYHNKGCHIVSNFLDDQSSNLLLLASSLGSVIKNRQTADTFSKYI